MFYSYFILQEQAVDEESKPMEIQMDATSEGSGNSVQTSFFRESWSTSVDPSGKFIQMIISITIILFYKIMAPVS